MDHDFVPITPAMAEELLKQNHCNRPIRWAKVHRLAEVMKRGGFKTTHQGICIAKNGRLLDGQHRLHAIVESGVTVTMLVVEKADEEIFSVIDGDATPRAISDRVTFFDDRCDNTTASHLVNAYLKQAVYRSPAPVAIDIVVETFESMKEGFTFVTKAFRTKRPALTRAGVGAAIATYHHTHKAKAEAFMHGYLTMELLSSGSPVLTLLNALQNGRIDAHNYENYWKTMSAIKAHLEGRPLQTLGLASSDLMGNKLDVVAAARSKRGIKGAKTRYGTEGGEPLAATA